MPFDFDTYQSKCEGLSPEQLHREWENYTRQISGGATSTATAVLFSPLTAGISLVGLGLSAPRIHNARKKRAIIEAKLHNHGQAPNTRKRDVIAPMAISGTIGGLTLGLAGPGADIIAGEAVGKGAEYAAAHIVLDATGAVIENQHDGHSKKKADQRMTAQYQNFQKQFIQEQAAQGIYLQPQVSGPQQGQQNLPGQQFIQQQPMVNQAYQPLPPSQDQKYEYVPVPAPQSGKVTYQPVSHQQSYAQPGQQLPPMTYQQLPPYSPMQGSGPQGAASNMPTQDPSRRHSVDQPQMQIYPTPCPTPLPVYSQAPELTFQQNSNLYSEPIVPVTDSKPPAIQAPIDTSALDCKSSILDFPLDVFELPAELVTAAVPEDDSIPATPSMEDEILILKARILQMEIEKRGGVIDIVPAHNTQPEGEIEPEAFPQHAESVPSTPANEELTQEQVVQLKILATERMDQQQNPESSTTASTPMVKPAEHQTIQIEIKPPAETVQEFDDFEPLSFYPPPPASPAPPPALLPEVPILRTETPESTIISSQMLRESSEASQAQNSSQENDVILPLRIMPIRQQTTPLPAPEFNQQQPIPRHASLTPSHQNEYSVPEQPQPPLPARPQSQMFQHTPVIQQQQRYVTTLATQNQVPKSQIQPSYQNQYVPQPSGVAGSYNPQTCSPVFPQTLAPSQLPTSRPQSLYQPLSLQTPQNTATTHQQQNTQQQIAYPPPPPSPNPQQQQQKQQQQRPAPTPRPQSVYQPQYAAPAQNTVPLQQNQQAAAVRPQSVYQSQYTPTSQNTPMTYQQQPAPNPRPQSTYQPQYVPLAQNSVPKIPQQQAPTQRPQSTYQPHYTPPPQPPSHPTQQTPTPAPRPQSVYQPLQFTPIQTQTHVQTPSPITHQQQQSTYHQPQPLKTTPLPRQDSGYYSIPPSRHPSTSSFSSFSPSPSVYTPSPSTSSFSSYSTPQILSPQSTGMLSPLSTGAGSLYHGRSGSVSQQPQLYFPPPPGSQGQSKMQTQVPGQGDYFGSKLQNQHQQQRQQQQNQSQSQGPNQQQNQYQHTGQFQGQNQQHGQNIGQQQGSAQQHPPPQTQPQGWQWGMPPPPPSQPNYGAPPPIPQPWK